MGVGDEAIQSFLTKIGGLFSDEKVKAIRLYTSMDTHGVQAEYLRNGANYGKWLKNLRSYVRQTNSGITVMVAFSALSIPRFIHFLEDILELNLELQADADAKSNYEHKPILIDIFPLNQPKYLSPWILNSRWMGKVEEISAFMNKNSHNDKRKNGFTEFERAKMDRIARWLSIMDRDEKELQHQRGSFFLFSKQYEAREGRKFLDVFPEMREFYAETKKSASESDRA